MTQSGDQIENPVTGQRMVFRRTSAETGGEVSENDGFFVAGGFAGPQHVHPIQDERFEVISGEAGFIVRGEKKVLGHGETLDVPRGVRHTFWNEGPDELHVRAWFHPGTPSTERFYEVFFRLGREGPVDRHGMPNLFLIALLAPEFADHVRLASPPWWVQRAVFALLRPVARLLGYQRRAEQLLRTGSTAPARIGGSL
ncbi:MAG TPA: cupin domain-containing protein [Candidatus Dormibacteraeota bacterium]|jgi:mannose-6-phosphate isomerase-like protein (cupin superfamily)